MNDPASRDDAVSQRVRSADGLVRPEVRALRLYSSNRAPCPIDLSDNTSQRGAPPSALRVASEAGAELFARYPSHYGHPLKLAAAEAHGVSADEVVTGCGSDDVLACAIRAFAGPGDVLAHPDPTFVMIPYFARTCGIEPVSVPLLGPDAGYDVDVDGLLRRRPKIVYVCSPNNPTGTLASREAIDTILRDAPGLVLLDEAYVEFGGESRIHQAREHGRLLVVRTMSKAYGLAGARAGYAVGAAPLVREIEKVRGPYKTSSLGERMAAAALKDDREWMLSGVREVLEAREHLLRWLEARSGKVARALPSSANFVLVPAPGAPALAEELRGRGIAVRPFESLPGIGDALRISIGPWPLMERTLDALGEVLP
jgi:histidinol-phosphate aminotransferase